MIEGIPLQIKHVNVNVNRPGFTFNPTNCNPTTDHGHDRERRRRVAPRCRSRSRSPTARSPEVRAQHSPSRRHGKTCKANGASLHVKASPTPPRRRARYANIAYVKVELPKQLPSRLTTLQKACTNAQFEANPAGVPGGVDRSGYAKVASPRCSRSRWKARRIFVSHGGEAFPSLTMVLQGYGVTIDLVGTTFISKAGITSTTFKTVPDAPFASFELTLPEGPYSALAANGNLCKDKLAMPTEFVAQNGAEIHESTKIEVTGCGKAKKAKHKKASHKKKHARKANKRR